MAEAFAALVALTVMEIVLGIDNVIFIAVVAGRLPQDQQPQARRLGLAAALGTRLLLLFALAFVASLDKAPAFKLTDLGLPESLFLPRAHKEAEEQRRHPGGESMKEAEHLQDVNAITWRDIVLLAGGLFLIYKATKEIHHKLEGEKEEEAAGGQATSFTSTLVQIAILDIVFSLDSVITAVGMQPKSDLEFLGVSLGMWVMITAMVLSMLVMLVFSGYISDFVARHPTVKMLALAFLILIGVMLVIEGLDQHVSKGYIYFAMAFSFAVEMLNLQMRKSKPVELHEEKMPAGG